MSWTPARLCLILVLLCSSLSHAQSALEEMRRDLAEGRYALAAQISGPSLVQAFPDQAEAHYLYARALYLTSDFEAARRELEQARALSGETAEQALLAGLLLAAEGDQSAKDDLRDAYERFQDYEIALAWGRVAWQSGDYEDALEAYSAAAASEQGRLEVWPQLNRGRMLKALGRLDEAVDAFQQAIAAFQANDPGDTVPGPGYVEAFFRLGEIYELLDDPKQAISFYEAALGADPNYNPARVAIDRLRRTAP